MRLRWLTLALLLIASPAAAQFSSSPGGSPTTLPCTLGSGTSCYADFTANGSAVLTASAASRVSVRVICNVANASDNDCGVTSYWCPAGTEAFSALLCKAIPFQDINGSSKTELNGDLSVWREAAEFFAPPRLFVVVRTVNQTTRVEVAGR